MSLNKNKLYCWFKSDTRIGLVHIGFEINNTEQLNLEGPHRVFQQAALVSNSELFVQAIELWQKIDLDLTPSDQPVDSGIHISMTLKAACRAEARPDALKVESDTQHAQGIVAVFPHDSLSRLAPLSDELSAVVNIESSSVSLQIELDDFEITSDEFDSLETGAVVILPKSYESEWTIGVKSITPKIPFTVSGSLKQNNDSAEIVLSLPESSGHQITGVAETNAGLQTNSDSGPESGAESAPGSGSHTDNLQTIAGVVVKDRTSVNISPSSGDHKKRQVKVECKHPCVVPIDRLLGDVGNVHLPLDTSQLSLTCDDRVLAHGSLLAYGRGGILAVNQMIVSS